MMMHRSTSNRPAMRRSRALTILAGAAFGPLVAGRATAQAERKEIPCSFEGGRIFAVARVAAGGRARFWLDTDGDGFLFEDAVARWKLQTHGDGANRTAPLPRFDPRDALPGLPHGGELVVFERSADDRADPILQGFDGQLGAGWFRDRVWTFDYIAKRVWTRTGASSSKPPNAGDVQLRGGKLPAIQATVDGESLAMAFDIAATVALAESAVHRLGDGGPAVRATSFVTSNLLETWRARHADWQVIENASVHSGVTLIRVPTVRVGATTLGPVWFSTRPGNDVFQGDPVAAKLGANAYDHYRVTLDYPNAWLSLEK